MLTPDLVQEFITAYADEMATLKRESGASRTQLEDSLAGVERRLEGAVRAIENGACAS